MNPPKAERAKPSLSSDYNLLFKNKIGESSLDIHRYNYYGVNGNYRAVRASWWYVKYVKKRLYWTLKRRSQKHRITIEKFGELWSKNIRNPFLPVNIW